MNVKTKKTLGGKKDSMLQSIKEGSLIIPRNLSLDSIMKASANMN